MRLPMNCKRTSCSAPSSSYSHPFIRYPPFPRKSILDLWQKQWSLSASLFPNIQPPIPPSTGFFRGIERVPNKSPSVDSKWDILLSHTFTFSPNLPSRTCSPSCSQNTTVRHILLQFPLHQSIRSNVGLSSSRSLSLKHSPISPLPLLVLYLLILKLSRLHLPVRFY